MVARSEIREQIGKSSSGVFIAIVLVAVLAAYALMGRFSFSTESLIGKPAPDFVLPVIYGGDVGDAIQLSNLGGEAVVLSFWASWCGPCRATAPSVDRLAKRLGDKGVTVVGINTMDKPDKGQAYARQIRPSFPIVSDMDGAVGAAYGVSSLPTIVVIDKDGIVRAKRTGMTDAGLLESLVLSSR